MEEIVNKVTKSGLVQLDLEDYYSGGERILFDIKDLLYQGQILREKNFREFIKEHDWSQYEGKNMAVDCSGDAIIPTWAYMLIATKLQPYANHIVKGNLEDLEKSLYLDAIRTIDPQEFEGAKVVIKGCGDIKIPDAAYVELTRLLKPVVSSLMYGEPCSTVPIYKNKQ